MTKPNTENEKKHISPNEYCWRFDRYNPRKCNCERCRHADDCIRRRVRGDKADDYLDI